MATTRRKRGRHDNNGGGGTSDKKYVADDDDDIKTPDAVDTPPSPTTVEATIATEEVKAIPSPLTRIQMRDLARARAVWYDCLPNGVYVVPEGDGIQGGLFIGDNVFVSLDHSILASGKHKVIYMGERARLVWVTCHDVRDHEPPANVHSPTGVCGDEKSSFANIILVASDQTRMIPLYKSDSMHATYLAM